MSNATHKATHNGRGRNTDGRHRRLEEDQMPRIYDSASDPHDFCKKHFPNKADAEVAFGTMGDGLDGRANYFCHDAEHPYYEFEEYTCERCGKLLSAQDN